MLHQNEDLCNKYFGQVSPEEIMDQFNRLDEEYVADGTGSNRAAGLVCPLSTPTNRVVSLSVCSAEANRSSIGVNSLTAPLALAQQSA